MRPELGFGFRRGPGRRGRGNGVDLPRDDAHLACGEPAREVELVRREHHGAAVGGRAPDDVLEHLTPVLVEPGVRFVEQQQTRLAGQRVREREPAALALGQAAVRNVRDPFQTHPRQRFVRVGDAVTGRPCREPHVLGDGEIVVTERLVPDERHGPAHAARFDGEIDTQHFSLARAQWQQTRAQPQQRGLARAVRAAEQQHLARLDLEIGACERGKSSEHADGRPKAYAAQPELRGPGVRYRAKLTEGLVTAANRTDHRARPSRHSKYHHAVRTAIAGMGRTLVTLGLLILLFVVYQLWGTGIFTARAQENLKSDFQKELKAADDNPVIVAPTTVTPGNTTPTVPHDGPVPPPTTPPEGDVEGTISIQRIGINFAFVEGTSRDDLKKGPGHYPGTPLPGTLGNAAIAGHRTTYLHPFGDLDKMLPGDLIVITTKAGTFVYRMSQKWFSVKSTDVWVVNNTPDPELTLTACHPKGSAEFRIVVKAKLVVNQSSRISISTPFKPSSAASASQQHTLAESLSGQTKSLVPSFVFGFFAAAVGLAWWWAFRRWRLPRTWLIGVLFFLDRAVPVLRVSGTGASRRLLTEPDRAQIEQAAARIAPFVRHTPVLQSHALDEWVGATVFVKAEHLQRVGAFKYRGATNAVQSLTEADARRGVAAHSSGNHAAALARAATTRGIPAYVVMPENVSKPKRAAVERYGAQVTFCDNNLDARRATLADVIERTGAVEIHPFDDVRVIAGAGTAALELVREIGDLDVVVTPIGGGGLCSGTCIAVAPVRVIGGVPRDRSSTIADGLRTGCSARTEAILREHGVEQVVVDEVGRRGSDARRLGAHEAADRTQRGSGLRRSAGRRARRCARRDHQFGRQRRPRRTSLVAGRLRPQPLRRRPWSARDAAREWRKAKPKPSSGARADEW